MSFYTHGARKKNEVPHINAIISTKSTDLQLKNRVNYILHNNNYE